MTIQQLIKNLKEIPRLNLVGYDRHGLNGEFEDSPEGDLVCYDDIELIILKFESEELEQKPITQNV